MDILILRHGQAEHGAGMPDRERALTAEGRAELEAGAAGLRALDVDVDLVLTSPYRRARQTAEIMHRLIPARGGLETDDRLASGASVREMLGAISEAAATHPTILVVGHMPDLAELAGVLLFGEAAVALAFRPGSLAHIELGGAPGNGRGVLRSFLTPRQLALIGRGS